MLAADRLLEDAWRPRVDASVALGLRDGVSAEFLSVWLDCLQGPEAKRVELPLEFQQGLQVGEQACVAAFLELVPFFLQLGRLPSFDAAEIKSLSISDQSARKVSLQVTASAVHLMPKMVYEVVFKAALQATEFMSINAPDASNREKLFDSIDKNVVQTLFKLVPAGKSTIPVLRQAYALGIPFIHLGMGIYQLGFGSQAVRLDRSSAWHDSAGGARLAQNKVSTANLLRMAGLPAPSHGVAGTLNEANAAANQLGFPLVVKPVDQDRGEGVTVDIHDSSTLEQAFNVAFDASQSKQVIVERQVEGVCHRVFVAGGRVLYAVKRLPMSVLADGERTVGELVKDEVSLQAQRPPWLRSEIRPIDSLALVNLRRVGLSPESIPSKGAWVPLRRIESTQWGGVDEDVTHSMHPDNIQIALDAAQQFGLQVAGIDIISQDISRPWHENGAIINEVNYAPLLGGAAISRSYLPEFFSRLLPTSGAISVITLDKETPARRAWKDTNKKGLRCFLLTESAVIDPRGLEIALALAGWNDRIRSLLCRPDLDALVLHSSAPSPAV